MDEFTAGSWKWSNWDVVNGTWIGVLRNTKFDIDFYVTLDPIPLKMRRKNSPSKRVEVLVNDS